MTLIIERMIMKLLLTIDGSKHSDVAVLEVSRRPWLKGTQAQITTVVASWTEELSRGHSLSMFDELNKQLHVEARQRLNDAAAVVKRKPPGLIVSPVLREGHPN